MRSCARLGIVNGGRPTSFHSVERLHHRSARRQRERAGVDLLRRVDDDFAALRRDAAGGANRRVHVQRKKTSSMITVSRTGLKRAFIAHSMCSESRMSTSLSTSVMRLTGDDRGDQAADALRVTGNGRTHRDDRVRQHAAEREVDEHIVDARFAEVVDELFEQQAGVREALQHRAFARRHLAHEAVKDRIFRGQ